MMLSWNRFNDLTVDMRLCDREHESGTAKALSSVKLAYTIHQFRSGFALIPHCLDGSEHRTKIAMKLYYLCHKSAVGIRESTKIDHWEGQTRDLPEFGCRALVEKEALSRCAESLSSRSRHQQARSRYRNDRSRTLNTRPVN